MAHPFGDLLSLRDLERERGHANHSTHTKSCSCCCSAAAVQDNFIDLVDCLLGPTGGFKLSLDYGANFEVGSVIFAVS